MSVEVGQVIGGEVVKSIATAQTCEDAECIVIMFESGGGIIMGVDAETGKFRDAIRLSANALNVVAQVVIDDRRGVTI